MMSNKNNESNDNKNNSKNNNDDDSNAVPPRNKVRAVYQKISLSRDVPYAVVYVRAQIWLAVVTISNLSRVAD